MFLCGLTDEDLRPGQVGQANARYINPTADERLTLVTCWPATGNSHRLIIIARPVSLSPRLPSPSSDNTLPGWDRTQAD